MPTRSSRDVLVDTSVAVALLVADHDFHDVAMTAIRGRRSGLAGHAAFETFSVLTRLPPPNRRSPASVARALVHNFPATVQLSPSGASRLLLQLEDGHIAGGSVYDALVACTAIEHNRPLLTADTRALSTYRALDADVEVLSARASG
jgi:predicted nucleic acid-binding protein